MTFTSAPTTYNPFRKAHLEQTGTPPLCGTPDIDTRHTVNVKPLKGVPE